MENKPIPIREILDNERHPYHEEVYEIVQKLQSGKLNLCGCIGKVGNDPYCPCEMERKGLQATKLWTDEKIQELNRVLTKLETK